MSVATIATVAINTMASLDLEYLQILRKIKPYITCIINTHYISLIKLWLEKLSAEPVADKQLRNSYLIRLGRQIEEGILDTPFTEPPPDGCLSSMIDGDDDNEFFYAAKEVQSSECVTLKNSNSNLLKLHKLDNKHVDDDESSWMDISDYSSARLSDTRSDSKINRLMKIIEQLRYENNQLMQIVNKNDTFCDTMDISEKAFALQKQLASAMIKNVELQKIISTLEEQLELYQSESTEIHNKELGKMKEQYETYLAKREMTIMQEIQEKLKEFSNKYVSLQEWYHSKLSEQQLTIESKYTQTYEQKIKHFKSGLEHDYGNRQKQFEEQKSHDFLKKQQEFEERKTAEITKLLDERYDRKFKEFEETTKQLRALIESDNENKQKEFEKRTTTELNKLFELQYQKKQQEFEHQKSEEIENQVQKEYVQKQREFIERKIEEQREFEETKSKQLKQEFEENYQKKVSESKEILKKEFEEAYEMRRREFEAFIKKECEEKQKELKTQFDQDYNNKKRELEETQKVLTEKKGRELKSLLEHDYDKKQREYEEKKDAELKLFYENAKRDLTALFELNYAKKIQEFERNRNVELKDIYNQQLELKFKEFEEQRGKELAAFYEQECNLRRIEFEDQKSIELQILFELDYENRQRQFEETKWNELSQLFEQKLNLFQIEGERHMTQKAIYEMKIEEMRLTHLKGLDDQRREYLKKVQEICLHYQKRIEELGSQNRQQLEEQLIANQKNMEELRTMHHSNLESERLRHFDILKEQVLLHEKQLETKNDELNKTEDSLRLQVARMQEEMKTLRVEFDSSKKEILDKSKKRMAVLQAKVSELEAENQKALRTYYKEIAKLQMHCRLCDKKTKILISAQRVDLIASHGALRQEDFEAVINQLEQKYKLILSEQENEAEKYRQDYLNKIQQLRADIPLTTLVRNSR